MAEVQTWGRLRDRPFEVGIDHCAPWSGVPREKRYRYASLGIVLSGSFEYYAVNGAGTAVPGTLLLGNPDEAFHCVHRSGGGNWRHVAQFEGGYLDSWAEEFGLGENRFRAALHPPGHLAAAILGCMHRL